MVALGDRIAGLMGNDDDFSATRWPAPPTGRASGCGRCRCRPTTGHGLDSDVADLKNIAQGRYGGALTAGLFLQEFVGEGIPWAHLDIAGPAWLAERRRRAPQGRHRLRRAHPHRPGGGLGRGRC